MALPQTVFDTNVPRDISRELFNFEKCDPNAYKWQIGTRMANIRDAVNELQDIVATLSATPIDVDPIEV